MIAARQVAKRSPSRRRGQATLDNYAGPPQSMLWRGGAVHLRSGAGQNKPPGPHSHFAIQLSVGCGNSISLRKGRVGATQVAPGWLVASDQPHWMHCNGTGVAIFFDPLFPAGHRLSTRLAGSNVIALSRKKCNAIRHELDLCWRQGWQIPELQAATDRIVDQLVPAAVLPGPLDPRVRDVIEHLMLDSTENVGLPELAAEVGLSESRLAHLFRRDVGIPMRQYRLSLRMVQAVTCIARGSSLTQAAHQAGFSDSAHFCRICRRMYGSAPSRLPEFETEES